MTANLRRAQLRARAPRALFYGLVVSLCLAGAVLAIDADDCTCSSRRVIS